MSMRMQPEEIRSGGKKIGHSGEDCEKVHETLSSGLEAEGECWGSDESGQEFAKGYVKSAKDVQEGIKKIAKALGDIKTNLQQTADDTESRDDQSGQKIGNIQKQLGG